MICSLSTHRLLSGRFVRSDLFPSTQQYEISKVTNQYNRFRRRLSTEKMYVFEVSGITHKKNAATCVVAPLFVFRVEALLRLQVKL